jgi:hypothetical protein
VAKTSASAAAIPERLAGSGTALTEVMVPLTEINGRRSISSPQLSVKSPLSQPTVGKGLGRES